MKKYGYELYYDGSFICSENDFETEEEARIDAEEEIEYQLECWYGDGYLTDEEATSDRDRFDIKITEKEIMV